MQVLLTNLNKTTAQDCHSEECNDEESHTTIAISTKQELDSSLSRKVGIVQNDIIAILRCSNNRKNYKVLNSCIISTISPVVVSK